MRYNIWARSVSWISLFLSPECIHLIPTHVCQSLMKKYAMHCNVLTDGAIQKGLITSSLLHWCHRVWMRERGTLAPVKLSWAPSQPRHVKLQSLTSTSRHTDTTSTSTTSPPSPAARHKLPTSSSSRLHHALSRSASALPYPTPLLTHPPPFSSHSSPRSFPSPGNVWIPYSVYPCVKRQNVTLEY